MTVAATRREEEESRAPSPLVYLLQLYMVASTHLAKTSPHHVVNKIERLQISHGEKANKKGSCKSQPRLSKCGSD